MSILYFAYGSNMAAAEMRAWAARERLLGTARLEGYRLGLRRRSVRWGAGVLDLLPDPAGEVWGALYELPAEALAELDRKEGAGFAYRRIEVEPLLAGNRVAAVAYEVIHKEPVDVPCSPEYAQLVLEAAQERGLPAGWHRELREGLLGAAAGREDG